MGIEEMAKTVPGLERTLPEKGRDLLSPIHLILTSLTLNWILTQVTQVERVGKVKKDKHIK